MGKKPREDKGDREGYALKIFDTLKKFTTTTTTTTTTTAATKDCFISC